MEKRVLIIDDEPSTLEMLRAELEQKNYDIITETSPEAGLKQLAQSDVRVVLSDINMRGMSGVELCRQVGELREDTPVIMMTAFATIEAAVASMRAGAYDFITKPIEPEDLAFTIERAIKHQELREEVKRLRRTVDELRPFDMIGESATMKRMFDVIARVADTEATVLVTGESGTGKRARCTRSP